MIKVLIAEDELPLLRGLKRLIEQVDDEFAVVKCAKDGREAIAYLEENPVHVVFTDMNMPIQDGADLLYYINQHQPKIVPVVISGYSDFEYAKDALNYGAMKYMLKPIDQQELKQVLHTIKSQIQGQKWDIIQDALLRNTDHEEISSRLDMELYMVYIYGGTFSISMTDEMTEGKSLWDRIELGDIIGDILGDGGSSWVFRTGYLSEQVGIISSKKRAGIKSYIYQLYKELADERIPITMAYSKPISNINQINITYQHLRKQVYNYSLYGYSQILDVPSNTHYKIPSETMEELSYILKNQQGRGLNSILQHIMDECKRQKVTVKNLQHVLMSIVQIIEKHSQKTSVLEAESSIRDIITSTYDYQRLIDDFLVICHSIIGKETFDIREKRPLMERVDSYIMTHITKSLTIQELSDEFGLVAPYLSKLFKSYKGMTPTRYIQSLKIEKAKELLHKKLLVKDIAEMLGYYDSAYFSKVFKKVEGVYPSEYVIHHNHA